MNRYLSMVCSVVFVGLVSLPCQVSAASITETSAAIGKFCDASGENSTAMGWVRQPKAAVQPQWDLAAGLSATIPLPWAFTQPPSEHIPSLWDIIRQHMLHPPP